MKTMWFGLRFKKKMCPSMHVKEMTKNKTETENDW